MHVNYHNFKIILTPFTQSSLALDVTNVFTTIRWPCCTAICSGVLWFYKQYVHKIITVYSCNLLIRTHNKAIRRKNLEFQCVQSKKKVGNWSSKTRDVCRYISGHVIHILHSLMVNELGIKCSLYLQPRVSLRLNFLFLGSRFFSTKYLHSHIMPWKSCKLPCN